MNKIFILILAHFIVANGSGQKNIGADKQFESLHWLVGNWERTNGKPGITAHEEWSRDSVNQLRGLGVTIKGNDTLLVEKIQIRVKDNNLYYVADVKENKASVYFKFTSQSKNAFVCENPEHDFPKKIEYSLKDTTLKVRISGDGKFQDYLFVKR